MPQYRETLETYLMRGGKIIKVPISKPLSKQERLYKYAEINKQKYAYGEKEVAQILESLCTDYEFQKIMGHYIVDFYLPEYNIIMEVDGKSHQWRKQKRRDLIRDHYFMRRGIITVRIPTGPSLEKETKEALQRYAGRTT